MNLHLHARFLEFKFPSAGVESNCLARKTKREATRWLDAGISPPTAPIHRPGAEGIPPETGEGRANGWKSRVERWYQLDAPAYGLCQLYEEKLSSEASLPTLLLLASREGSYETDRQFASQGAMSPQAFVHTLPNIRASALMQAMNWSGPMLCFQNGPNTLATALEQAVGLSEYQNACTWIVGCDRIGSGTYRAYQLEVSNRGEIEVVCGSDHGGSHSRATHEELLEWLKANSPANKVLRLSTGIQLRRLNA